MVLGNFTLCQAPDGARPRGGGGAAGEARPHCGGRWQSRARERLRAKQAEVSVEPGEPDHIAPEEEFLVLDADASQNVAINRVLRGQNLIIKGPPGTGKSQTIANIIASLLGRGQKVLFVAEKRAAIDAVFHRLNQAGLSDMLLDVHAGAGSRRQIAENLARAMNTMATTPRPAVDGLAAELVSTRARLRAHADAMHLVRPPWDISVLDAIERAAGLPDAARTEIRLKAAELQLLSRDRFDGAERDLKEFLDLGGAQFSRSAWADADDRRSSGGANSV